MRRPAYRRAVARVAEDLLRYRLLLPEEIQVLIEVADGKTSEADLVQFRTDYPNLEQQRQRYLSLLTPAVSS